MSLGFIVPGLPHPLLAPHQNPGWAAIRAAYESARRDLEASDADLLVLYTTQWPSVIGHQLLADPEPEWELVDQDWHALGTIPYKLRIDAGFAKAWEQAAHARGLHARTVAYRGFPVDTGTIVALKLLNPDNRLPAVVVSCNMYADRAETIVLGKAARDAVESGGRKPAYIAVTALSARLFPHPIDPAKDQIASAKDDEWNRKLLEILGAGRLEDASQLMRTFSQQANGDQRGKAVWWLSAALGQSNRYDGKVYDYQAIWGTGAAVVGLWPSAVDKGDPEFDEADVDTHHGDRSVLQTGKSEAVASSAVPAAAAVKSTAPAVLAAKPPADPLAVHTATAPSPVGPYPHARRVGELLFVSGMGPRQPGTNEIPGGPVRDPAGNPLPYDVAAQTRAVIENIERVLVAAGARLADVVDVSVFLIDMDRDFAAFNEVYREFFASIGPTRTTVEVRALPTPIAVELKVIAKPKASS